MRFRMRLDVDFLSEAELEKIFQAALRVWRQVPFRIQGTDEFNDYLSRFGCRIDGDLVRFPEAVIEKTLARIREHAMRVKQEATADELRSFLFASVELPKPHNGGLAL